MNVVEKENSRGGPFVQANLASGICNLVIIGYYAISWGFFRSRVLTVPWLRVSFIFIFLPAEAISWAAYCPSSYQYRGNSEAKWIQ